MCCKRLAAVARHIGALPWHWSCSCLVWLLMIPVLACCTHTRIYSKHFRMSAGLSEIVANSTLVSSMAGVRTGTVLIVVYSSSISVSLVPSCTLSLPALTLTKSLLLLLCRRFRFALSSSRHSKHTGVPGGLVGCRRAY